MVDIENIIRLHFVTAAATSNWDAMAAEKKPPSWPQLETLATSVRLRFVESTFLPLPFFCGPDPHRADWDRLRVAPTVPETARRFLLGRYASAKIRSEARPGVVDDAFGLWCVVESDDAEDFPGDWPKRLAEIRTVSASWDSAPAEAILRSAIAVRRRGRDMFERGRAARRAGRPRRAARWFARTHAWECSTGRIHQAVIAAVAEAGAVAAEGNRAAAERILKEAVVLAEVNGCLTAAAWAYHDLMALAIDDCRLADAVQLAERAAEGYGPCHANLPRLAHDVATAWALAGEYARALPVFEALLPLRDFEGHDNRVLILASLAECAAHLGLAARFRAVAKRVREAATTQRGRLYGARAFIQVARGAVVLGRIDDAESALGDAVRVASERGEAGERWEALRALRECRAGRRGRAEREERRVVVEAPHEDEFARRLVRSLRAIAKVA